MGILIVTTLVFTLLFIGFFKRNYASLLNGFLFMCSSFFILFLGGVLAIRLENQIVNTILIIIAMPIFIILAFSIFIAIFTLLFSSYKLFRNESKSLSNSLTLLVALGLILYIVLTIIAPSGGLPYVIQVIWGYVTVILVFYVFHISCFITSAMLSYKVRPRLNKDYIIVLGSGLINGEVPPLLAKRIERAITFYKKQKKVSKPPILLFSGGQGHDESRPESIAMQEYAIKQGIPIEDTLVETKSATTQQNFKFSKQLIEQTTSEYKAIFATSNYHVFRSAGFAKAAGMPIFGLGARTIWYFYINALIREYIAHIWIHKKGHAIFVGLIILFGIILFIFTTIFNQYTGI